MDRQFAVKDKVEFLSDRQTEKGPSSGSIVASTPSQIAIQHSDTVEWFDLDRIIVAEAGIAHDGRWLWKLT